MGTAECMRRFISEAIRRGWRCCVFIRRGHGVKMGTFLPLTSPRFNLLGSSTDMVPQMDAVSKRWGMEAYTAMVGISCGSGLIKTYLGTYATRTRVKVGVSLCPGYDANYVSNEKKKSIPPPPPHTHMHRSLAPLFYTQKRCSETFVINSPYWTQKNLFLILSVVGWFRTVTFFLGPILMHSRSLLLPSQLHRIPPPKKTPTNADSPPLGLHGS